MKTIALYVTDILYKSSEVEGYPVKLAYALQNVYPNSHITFITECYSRNDEIPEITFVTKLNKRFGTDLKKQNTHVMFISGSRQNALSNYLLKKRIENSSRDFDLMFYCSQGNYIFKAKKNICVVNFPTQPLTEVKKKSFGFSKYRNKAKDTKFVESYDLFLPESKFSQEILSQWWPEIDDEKNILLYPLVSKIPFTTIEKEKIILICTSIERSKNIETLIDAYKTSEFLRENYRLVVLGGLKEEDRDYQNELKLYIGDANVVIEANPSFQKIVNYYNKSQILWHAKGFGVDDSDIPSVLEQFGITTVEAMSTGCVPIVINKADQKEIVTEECGYKWNTIEELINYTEQLAKDQTKMKEMSAQAIARSRDFSMDTFTKNLSKALNVAN